MAAAAAAGWDADEEKAREKRIAERRARVQDRLRLLQQRSKPGEGGGAQHDAAAPCPGAKGKHQAAASTEVVRALLSKHTAMVAGVVAGAEGRLEAHHVACEAEEAALREQVAAEAEASRRENRAIDLEWEQLQGETTPQGLAAGISAVSARCARVLESKQGAMGAAHALLSRRDDQFVRLLRQQAEETEALIASMHGQHGELRAVQEQELEAVEAAYLQERSELLAAQKAELDVLLERRSAAEAEFMEQYLGACEQYENELERLRVEGLAEHGSLKRRLESEVASLEAHLDGIKATYMLNADKLDYNYRVLVERERESKDALMQQKRKITRQWEVLNRLRKRHAAAEGRAAAENARLSDEYQHVTRAFNHLQTKFRHFKAADLARFEQVRGMKEEELSELLEQLLEAEHLIASFVVGLPQPGQGEGQAAAPAVGGGGQLEVVGQAVTVDPLAAAAAAAMAGPGEGPAEVVALSAGEAAERRQLIPAFHPAGAQQHGTPAAAAAAGGDASSNAHGTAALDPAAEEEIRASASSGALSLLMRPASRQVESQQLRRMLEQLSAAGGRLTSEAVARSLGLQRSGTVAALERACGLASSGGAGSGSLADTIGPREAVGEKAAAPSAAGSAWSMEGIEQGLNSLLRQVLADGRRRSSTSGQAAGNPAPQPTSKQYWQARADAMLPAGIARAWGLLEVQASKRMATLQGRTGAADEVLALRQENERLKSTLAGLLSSPKNRELQLPPTLLLL